MGLDPARCAAALADYQTTGMRQHIVEHGGVTFIEDCYNASPDSMRAALSVLKELPNPRKIALLGDMLELGTASEEGHRNAGVWAADAGVDQLIAYGPCSAAMAEAAKAHGVATVHCQTAAEVLQYLRQFVRPGDAVLAKASHAMGRSSCWQDLQGIAAGVKRPSGGTMGSRRASPVPIDRRNHCMEQISYLLLAAGAVGGFAITAVTAGNL